MRAHDTTTVWCGILTTLLLASCASQPTEPPSDDHSINLRAARYALQVVGAPYRYGGNTPRGFDCSGLVQYSYARAGVVIPRTTREQRRHSHAVNRKHLRPGDLLFFDQLGKRGSHVGLYLGDQRFVHAPASGKAVHVSTLSNPYWQRHLLEIRRFSF
jgi:cell wall-associated NlpC family hydrolase